MKNIKTLLFFLILSILYFSASYAQEINFGLSIGYGRTSPIYDNDYNSEIANNHFNFMTMVEFSAYSTLRFQSGIKYFKTGYSHEVNYNFEDIRTVVPPPKSIGAMRSYLAIPIDLNYFLPFTSGVYLSGGIEGLYLLSAKSYSEDYNGEYKEWDTKDDFKNHFFMFIVGIGYEFQVDRFTLFIEPEYSRSTRAINSGSSFRMEQISINIGVKI